MKTALHERQLEPSQYKQHTDCFRAQYLPPYNTPIAQDGEVNILTLISSLNISAYVSCVNTDLAAVLSLFL